MSHREAAQACSRVHGVTDIPCVYKLHHKYTCKEKAYTEVSLSLTLLRMKTPQIGTARMIQSMMAALKVSCQGSLTT